VDGFTATGIPQDQIPKIERDKAKAVTFGSGLYGQSPEGLAATAFAQFRVKLTVEQAGEYQAIFHNAYPELFARQQEHYQECRQRGYVLAASGRIIRPNSQWEWVTKQDAYNWGIQADAADCMLRALAYVYWALAKARIRGGIIATVHDEILLEVHADDMSAALEIVQRQMVRAFEASFPGAPSGDAVVEIGHGPNWLAAAGKEKEA
jgi:DNA polymerase-1